MKIVELRPELEPLPVRMAELPIDTRGYPVPWFVEWIDGPDGKGKVPEFRAMDPVKWVRAVKEKMCWVCGKRLGSYLTFVIGPMCGINRVSAEPPSHRECGEWSVRNCPFMARPEMVRREGGPGVDAATIEEAKTNVAGFMIERNPKTMLLWTTHSYKLVPDSKGMYLIEIGDPVELTFWFRGRPATREQIEESVREGLPLLEEKARPYGPKEEARLATMVEEFWGLVDGAGYGAKAVLEG